MPCTLCGKPSLATSQFCATCKAQRRKAQSDEAYRRRQIKEANHAKETPDCPPIRPETIEKVRQWREAQEARHWHEVALRQREQREVVKYPCSKCDIPYRAEELQSGRCESCWQEYLSRDVQELGRKGTGLVGTMTCKCSRKKVDGVCPKCHE